MAVSHPGGLARLGGGAIEFRGPAQALAALVAAAFLAFGLPWMAQRAANPLGTILDSQDGEGAEFRLRGRVTAASLAAALAVGAWMPFAALWARAQPGAEVHWLWPAAGAIAAVAGLREMAARRAREWAGQALVAGALLLGLWVISACFLLPGSPSWMPGEDDGPQSGARGEWEIVEADVDLAGPLTSATVAYEGYPPLEISAELIAGESKGVRAWIVAPRNRSFAAHERPDLVEVAPSNVGGVAVRPLASAHASGGDPGLDEDGPSARDPLFQRALPPIGSSGGRVPISAWLAAAAAALFLALMALRFGASAGLAPVFLAVGALVVGGATAAFCLGGSDARQVSGAQGSDAQVLDAVLEGRRMGDGAASWALVERFRAPLVGSLSAAPAPDVRIRLQDLRGPLRTRLSIAGSGPGQRSIEARDGDQAIDRLTSPVDPGLRVLMREVNTLGGFEAAWARSPGGAWAGGGPWPVGEAWDGEVGGLSSSEPPEWAGAGLPMGLGLFFGRLGPTAAGNLGLGGGGRPGSAGSADKSGLWVRLLGF